MRESIDPMATPGAGAASRWSAPAAGEPRAGRSARTHRADEFPAGYSSAGCSPAEPTSASPASSIMYQDPSAGDDSPANGNLSPFSLSHHRGSVHFWIIRQGDRLLRPFGDFGLIRGQGRPVYRKLPSRSGSVWPEGPTSRTTLRRGGSSCADSFQPGFHGGSLVPRGPNRISTAIQSASCD